MCSCEAYGMRPTYKNKHLLHPLGCGGVHQGFVRGREEGQHLASPGGLPTISRRPSGLLDGDDGLDARVPFMTSARRRSSVRSSAHPAPDAALDEGACVVGQAWEAATTLWF